MALNGLLRAVGLELRSRPRTMAELQSCPQLATSGRIVEFIGTQGIGKSTLNNNIYKHLKPRWFFRHHIQSIQVGPVRSEDVEDLHRRIYFKRMGRLMNSQLDPREAINIARRRSIIASESLLLSSVKLPRGFFVDEGLVKNFPEEVAELDPEDAALLWQDRAFIYMRARDPEFAVSRYQGRVADRLKKGSFQTPRTDDEVLARVEADTRLFDRIHEAATSFGRPAIIIHPEDGAESNAREVLDFERLLSS